MQLMTPIIPRLNELSKEGQQGRNKINQYTHWLTVPLAFLQAYGHAILFTRSSTGRRPTARGLRALQHRHVHSIAGDPDVDDRRHDAAGLDGRADHRDGHRQRHSIIIFGGIVASLPSTVGTALRAARRRGHHRRSSRSSAIALITVVGIVLDQ